MILIFMDQQNLDFHWQTFDCVVGGKSVIDIPRLNIKNIEEANLFLKSYGYDWDSEKDREQLWSFHRQAVTLLRDVLLKSNEEKIPEVITDPNQLGHVGFLLVYASTEPEMKNHFQRWSCALLRIMHVLVHLRNDISAGFIDEIQTQVLKPFKSALIEVPGVSGVAFGRPAQPIKLHRFDVKPIKTSTSSVIKLLANPHYVVPYVMDRIGIRFVTKGVFDSFQILRFLLDEKIISYPNNIPDQARNTLYPTNLFFELMAEIKKEHREYDMEKLEALLTQKLAQSMDRAEYREKYNAFSSSDYRAIKFINRRRINIQQKNNEVISFYYPFEVQIMDHTTYLKTLSGPTAHNKYKERQIQAARKRVLGLHE